MPRRRYYHQEKANTCAVACVRTVLAIQFGVAIPEAALEALGQVAHSPIAKVGSDSTDLRRMVAGASRAYNTKKPWTFLVRCHGSLSDLKRLTDRGRVVLCDVRAGPNTTVERHMIVVLGVTKRRVRIFDPGDTHPKNLTFQVFTEWWQDIESGSKWYATIGGGS